MSHPETRYVAVGDADVAGSELAFTDRGAHALHGVPDEWHLFAVSS
jgi:hypothetical protein